MKTIPEDFPVFSVPGQEKAMSSLRELYWLHYPGSGPKATLWDEWLAMPSLWPAVATRDLSGNFRREWQQALSARLVGPDGYVATHQHPSISHTYGWPFPMWIQGEGGFGWHFSFKDTVGPPWRNDTLSTQSGWLLEGLTDAGIGEDGWNLALSAPNAHLCAPDQAIDSFQAPFLQLRWQAHGLGQAQPYVEWICDGQTSFSAEQRQYFEPVETSTTAYTMIAMYKNPKWSGQIHRLRLGFGNAAPEGSVMLQALFSHYDTRHNVNSQSFIRGCADYFWWTGDLVFLRQNINRMRLALHHMMREHATRTEGVVLTSWSGHDGRSGLAFDQKGQKRLLAGHGVGNNYWDLIPFGWKDAYATLRYYDTLLVMAQLEEEIQAHPEWNVLQGALRFDPADLRSHAEQVKTKGNELFWNPKTGRFVACIDADGNAHDYGFTFVNCEAIYYGFATAEHARSILSWLSGERKVEGDTAQGADIYHWRFAPRATTRRNIDYYVWVWSGPESIAWGGQVQDGGAVLGFSYHDLMARLQVLGADDAWARLQEILAWFDEVQAAGGYRKYYDGKTHDGTLQGGGTAGGLGLDCEFFESVMVPQVMLRGFLGFCPTGDGIRLAPQLPSQWPELSIDHIGWRDQQLRVRATSQTLEIRNDAKPTTDSHVKLIVPGNWTARADKPGINVRQGTGQGKPESIIEIDWTLCREAHLSCQGAHE